MSKVARSLFTVAFGFGTLTSVMHAADNFLASAGTVFVMTNDAAKNEVLTYQRLFDGRLTLKDALPLGVGVAEAPRTRSSRKVRSFLAKTTISSLRLTPAAAPSPVFILSQVYLSSLIRNRPAAPSQSPSPSITVLFTFSMLAETGLL